MSITATQQEHSEEKATYSLPPLREELTLHGNANYAEGEPIWTLHDPVANRFFRLNWLDFEILSRWTMNNAQQIAEDIDRSTTLRATTEDVDRLVRFLATHDLIQIRGDQALAHLQERAAKAKKRDIVWLLKNYLFMRFPLISPQRFLDATAPSIQWLWSKAFAVVTVICGVLGIILVLRQWDTFLATFLYFFSLEGLLVMAVALTGAKIIHEFGHAYTAQRYGCRVPTMGVALLVLWPVLYTDATDTWKLASRRQRLHVAAAGMGAEIVLAAYATLLWSFLDDGVIRSAVFLLATSTWIITLLINLNPFMRFDGYYLLSDMLGVANLQERAFALARWQLREVLFGFGDSAPEYFPPKRRKTLLIYAYGTWIYRFFLFLGIALLVYHLFFKLLGIFLMIVELVWFIGMPMFREFREWFRRRQAIRFVGNARWTMLATLLVLLLLFVPWQVHISAPALWRAVDYSRLFSPSSAQVAQINVQPGARVKANDVLFTLTSPELDFAIEQGKKELEVLTWKVKFQGLNKELLARSLVSMQELQTETAAQHSRLKEQQKLTIRSPIDGIVAQMKMPLNEGDWLTQDALMALIISPKKAQIEAWVTEDDLARIKVGQAAMFYPDDISRPPFSLQIKRIDNASTKAFSEGYLASINGGDIAVRQDEKTLVPEKPVYRVLLEPTLTAVPFQVVTGTVAIEGQRQSLVRRITQKIISVFIRESGF